MSRVLLSGVVKSFGSAHALRGVTLDIRAGAYATILGPSGCGKSTLLRAVAGLVTPDEGSIRFDDRDVTTIAPSQRGIAMLVQGDGLYPHLSGLENLTFAPRLAGASPQQARDQAAAVAERLGVSHVLGRPPGEMSGGERRRIALAKALVMQPRVLLLDEPTSAIDLPLRREIASLLRELHAQRPGLTVLHVTHDVDEALTLGETVVFMAEGRVIQVGTPDEIRARPAEARVASFIAPGGVAEAKVDASDEGALFIRLGKHVVTISSLSAPSPSALTPGTRVLAARDAQGAVSAVYATLNEGGTLLWTRESIR